MNKEELYRRAERTLNQALEVAKKSIKVVAEKAGEAAQVTKLLVEKAALEHRVTRQFTRLGGALYEKVVREGQETLLEDSEIRELIEEAKKLEDDLVRVEETLEGEQKQKKSSKRRTRS